MLYYKKISKISVINFCVNINIYRNNSNIFIFQKDLIHLCATIHLGIFFTQEITQEIHKVFYSALRCPKLINFH